MSTHDDAIPDVARRIRNVRGQRVLLDTDLALLYGVSTKRLKEQVRRNIERFPSDFVFTLTDQELTASRSQIATLNKRRGHNVKYLPMAFTEHGAIMAATVLNSPTAVEMSVLVVRAFVKLRQMLASTSALTHRLETLERSVSALDANTREEFVRVYKAILKLMGPAPPEQ
jgi:phage regulator Rha-like protein